MPIEQSFFNSPLGILEIKVTAQWVWSILFTHTNRKTITISENTTNTKSKYPLTMICQQLTEYFSGERTIFELPLQQTGTAFQQKIWSELTNIPFGKTISYLALSIKIGNSKAIRAVGAANGNNSICIVVPCHRVIGSNGDLKGYNGDLWRKKWLLEHEGKHTNGVQNFIGFSKDLNSKNKPI
jgi:methylated-DNA-[protein]-cysteine S-methyltransferase